MDELPAPVPRLDGIRSIDRLVVDSPPNDRRIEDTLSLPLPIDERPGNDRVTLEPLWFPSLKVRDGNPLNERLDRSPPPLNDRDDSPPPNDRIDGALLPPPPLKLRGVPPP